MKKYIGLILISTFLFSTMEIAIKCTDGAFNSIQLNFIRFLIGGLVLLPLAMKKLKKKGRRLDLKDLGYFLITGFICIIISMTLFTGAVVMKGSNPAIIAVIFSFNPIFTIALASVIFKEKITKGIIGGLIICFIGLIFVINPFHLSGSALPSMMMALASGFTFALYSIMSKFTIVKRKLDGLTVTVFTFLIGSAELLIIIGLSHIKSISNFMISKNLSMFSNIPILHGISMHNIILLLYISIFVSGISFALFFMVMENTSATMSSLIFFIKPVLSPILALILIHDMSILDPHNYIGVIFMAVGSVVIFMMQLKLSKQK
ncbi:MAG: DMT family transporter [Clostridium sp.]|uniref:DMT family transporter n=1 Tax=Clostridium sp. TaxID=1506 RepID=UPI003EE4BBAD